VYQLLNSPHQQCTLYHPVEIQKQIAPEEAEVPEPEPRERNVTVLKLTEGSWSGQGV